MALASLVDIPVPTDQEPRSRSYTRGRQAEKRCGWPRRASPRDGSAAWGGAAPRPLRSRAASSGTERTHPLRRADTQAGVSSVGPRDGIGPSVVRNLRVPRPRRPRRGERSGKPMPCAASKIAASRKPTARTGARAARAKSRPHTPEGRARGLSVPGRRPRGAAASFPALARGRRANGRAARKPPKTVGPLPSFKYA